jgi:hypothetical protein
MPAATSSPLLRHLRARGEAGSQLTTTVELVQALGHRLGPAVTMTTTEHFNLQSARAATITEANGRASIYLAAL